MQRQRLTGGGIQSGAYDSREQTLEIEFADGRVRSFVNVPEQVWQRLRAAPNAGTYYEDRIADEYPAREAGRASVRDDARSRLDALFGAPKAPE